MSTMEMKPIMECKSQTAKIFMNGRSQAVRLPAGFRFSVREVFIERQGDAVVIRPKPLGWDDLFARPSQVPEDFMAERNDLTPEKRELF
jgi:antitoxin VapB